MQLSSQHSCTGIPEGVAAIVQEQRYENECARMLSLTGFLLHHTARHRSEAVLEWTYSPASCASWTSEEHSWDTLQAHHEDKRARYDHPFSLLQLA